MTFSLSKNNGIRNLTGDDREAALFQALWDSPSQAVATLDFTLDSAANDAFKRLFRLPETGEAPVLLPLFPGENIQLLDKVRDGKINGFETEVRVGSDRFVRVQVLTVDTDSDEKQALLLASDVTENHVFQEELTERLEELEVKNQELNRYIEAGLQLENFAWIASHDLKEPIRTIGNFAQLLERRYADRLDQTGLEFLGFIRTAVGNMHALVEDLVTYSTVCQTDNNFENFRLRELFLQEKLKINRLFADVDWQLDLPENLPETTIGNRQKIGQLVFHLLHNSLKFRQKETPSRVKISSKETDSNWQFTFEDNGIGIQKEFFERVFLLFKRLHARQVFPGSGIGLAICKKIAEQHNGRIWLEEHGGEGCRFHFTLSKRLKITELPEEE